MITLNRRRAGATTKRAGTRGWLLASAFAAFPMGEALAQSSTNVATVAVDAFGERVGTEQIGLYSEQQVRGFSLQDSGNYRLDGAYFIRSANIVPIALDGTTIRVGINALGVDFPAPSGIVEYRTAVSPPGLRAETELQWRDYGGQSALARISAGADDGRVGAAFGFNIMNETGPEGQKRRPRWAYFVPTWRPNAKLQVKGLFSLDRFTRIGGDYTVRPSGASLPPVQPNPGKYWTDWGLTDQLQLAGGVIARYAATERLAVQASYVVTDLDRWRTDVTTLDLRSDGTGVATSVRGRPIGAQSHAAEMRLQWKASATHRLFSTLRWRSTYAEARPGVVTPIGFVDQQLGLPDIAEPPEPPEVDPTVDDTRQIMGGLGYEGTVGPSLWFRGAVLRTRYEKTISGPGRIAQTNTDTPWLYDFAVTYTPIQPLTLFATTVRGLEETGSAPVNAANRNEVLPPVMATQYELGLRYRISSNITFISSLFQISKGTPGMDTQNVFRLIGQARHRGLELSLVGRPTPWLNVLSGLVVLDPKRQGELIDRGILIGRAAGLSKVTGLLNVTVRPPSLKGVSIDTQVTYNSRQLVSPRTGLYASGLAVLDLGARYEFRAAGQRMTLRARVGNVLNEDQWTANRNETISRVPRRAFRLALTTNFGG